MKKYIFHLSLLCSVVWFSACEDDYGQFLEDNRPEVPVTFPNATTYGFTPFILVPIGSGAIEFVMEIPQESGLGISQISQVAAGFSVDAGDLAPASAASSSIFYQGDPIAGNNNQATFTTTIDEINQAIGDTLVIDDELQFIFEIQLSNGETIIPTETRAFIVE